MKCIICCISTFALLTAGTSFAAHPLVSDDAGPSAKERYRLS